MMNTIKYFLLLTCIIICNKSYCQDPVFIITQNNFVGIGTQYPQAKLMIKDSSEFRHAMKILCYRGAYNDGMLSIQGFPNSIDSNAADIGFLGKRDSISIGIENESNFYVYSMKKNKYNLKIDTTGDMVIGNNIASNIFPDFIFEARSSRSADYLTILKNNINQSYLGYATGGGLLALLDPTGTTNNVSLNNSIEGLDKIHTGYKLVVGSSTAGTWKFKINELSSSVNGGMTISKNNIENIFLGFNDIGGGIVFKNLTGTSNLVNINYSNAGSGDYIDDNRNFAFGNKAPTQKLEVTGNFTIVGGKMYMQDSVSPFYYYEIKINSGNFVLTSTGTSIKP